MASLISNRRLWWQPPRSLRDRPTERQVTFFELFYDLVYVVIIAELAHALSGHIDLVGLAQWHQVQGGEGSTAT